VSAHIDSKWVDIVSPVAPVPVADPVALAAVMAALLVLFAVGFWFYRRPRLRNRRALLRLARALPGSPGETRLLCFEIRRCLRSGLQQRRLRSIAWADADPGEWRDYLERLTHFCYAADTPAVNEVDGMIHEGRAWLRRKVADR
jgi:hypothetical protein